MITIIAGTIGLVASIATGVYFLDEHYLTHNTGVSRETAYAEFIKKSELIAAQEETSQYLLDLRIEQAVQRERDYEERDQRRTLSSTERNRLQDVRKELDRLYDIKEQQR
jgi:hypothetical protein